MKIATALPMLRLALSALDRETPNVELARGILREIAGAVVETSPEASSPRAVPIKRAAELLGMCPKTIRGKVRRGEIPAIGSGRSTRVLIDEAIQALRGGARSPADDVEAKGREWATRRGALRVVNGGE